MKALSRAFMILVFGILYIPMIVLVLFSFNKSNSTGNFTGFSLKWYAELFSNGDAFVALRNTLVLALCSAALATVIGTLAAVGVHKMKNKHKRGKENNACAEDYKYILNKACEQIAYKRDTRYRHGIGQLSRNMVNMVALRACGRHDRCVRNG